MKRISIILLVFSFLFQAPCAFSADKLVVLLDWFANPDHAPLFVAEEKGFFKQQGLDVELIGPADPSDPPKLVAAGKADIAITYQPQFLQQVEQGFPLLWLGTLINKPLNCLVVLQDGPIHSLADLKNKRIGYSNSGTNSIMLNVMLKKYGLDLKDVESINIHYDLTQALLSGKVDAVTGMMRNFEIIQMQLAGKPAKAFFPENNGIPTYNELIFVVQKDQAQADKFKRFLRAITQGVNYLHQYPNETWQVFAKTHPELNNELNHRAWIGTLPYFAHDPGSLNTNEFMNFAHFMQQNGLIKQVKPLSQYAVSKE
ncbi:MAG: MetQ/NlpA family ABC transporter substrate-binding protein [Gammaproteobacteria bacterium]|nr:MetQ/NlpA family ABC transporter substrate-binding protein [Gammaproteobacteria bacterium]